MKEKPALRAAPWGGQGADQQADPAGGRTAGPDQRGGVAGVYHPHAPEGDGVEQREHPQADSCFVSRVTVYSGLLEKCPAIAFTDRTVVSEEESGLSMRRRTNAYTFDRDLYKHWVAGGGVWIGEGADKDNESCTPPSPCNGSSAGVAGDDIVPEAVPDNSLLCTYSTCVSTYVSSCKEGDIHPCGEAGTCTPTPVSNLSSAEEQGTISPAEWANVQPGEVCGRNSNLCGSKDAEEKSRRINARDYKRMDLPEQTACFVCGRKDSRYIEQTTTDRKSRPKDQQGGRRICKQCYQAAVDRERTSAPPLPEVIDIMNMERVSVSIGRCTVCDLEPAAWSDRRSGVRLCEGCYDNTLHQTNGKKI